MDAIRLDTLRDEVDEAARVLSQGMVHNPVHVAVLRGSGDRQRRQLEMMLRLAIGGMAEVMVARDGERIVAAAGMVQWPRCQPSLFRGVRFLLPALLTLHGAIPRALRWAMVWQRQHPRMPHSHFGPFAVLPELQGRGIGSRMLDAYCTRLDEAHEASYLETDKDVNVRLYQRFGYQVMGQAEVLGVQSWFMWRAAK